MDAVSSWPVSPLFCGVVGPGCEVVGPVGAVVCVMLCPLPCAVLWQLCAQTWCFVLAGPCRCRQCCRSVAHRGRLLGFWGCWEGLHTRHSMCASTLPRPLPLSSLLPHPALPFLTPPAPVLSCPVHAAPPLHHQVCGAVCAPAGGGHAGAQPLPEVHPVQAQGGPGAIPTTPRRSTRAGRRGSSTHSARGCASQQQWGGVLGWRRPLH